VGGTAGYPFVAAASIRQTNKGTPPSAHEGRDKSPSIPKRRGKKGTNGEKGPGKKNGQIHRVEERKVSLRQKKETAPIQRGKEENNEREK